MYQNDATCTADGTEKAVCDREGCSETDVRVKEGSAAGHSYGDPVWTWTDDFNAAVTFTCEREDDVQTPEVTVTSTVTTSPTATAAGKKVYTATAEFGGIIYTDTKEEVLPATGEPETPAGPETPAEEDLCKWCHQPHEGVFGRITAFFHSILYFFAHLFGIR